MFFVGFHIVFEYCFGQSFESIVHTYGSVGQKQYFRLLCSFVHLYGWIIPHFSSKYWTRDLFNDIEIRRNSRSFSHKTRKFLTKFSEILNNYCFHFKSIFGEDFPLIFCGVIALISALLVLNLPETLGKELPENFDDIDKLKHAYEHAHINHHTDSEKIKLLNNNWNKTNLLFV